MKTKSFKQRFQAGTGLIEVLVAILVLAVGMLGMSKLNALLIRDGGTANNRAIAVSLAQEKLDDLRGFKWLNAISSYGENCGAGIFCFSEIATNTGGYEAPISGALRFPTGNVTVGNTTYNRTWTVVDNSSFKLVTVTVNWTDQNGATSEALTSAIWGDDAGVTAFGAGGPGIALGGPKVPYNAEADAVRIEIGSSAYKESSKPVPDVSQHGDSTMVTFETTDYSTPDNKTISKEEFVTLSCVCEFESANTRQGRTPTRMIWNNQTKELEPELGELVTKVTGRKPTTGSAANQPEFCDSCCRDHHDIAGDTHPKYQPSRPSGDYSSGDHKHYWPNNSGTLVETSSGNYLEACRFERVDGLFYAMQDWKMVDLVVMPKDNYLDNSTTMAAYQTYLEGWIAGNAPNKNTLVDRDLVSLAQGQQAQLLARGLYIDPIYQCRPGAVGVISGQSCVSGVPTSVDSAYTSYVSTLRAADTGNVGAWRKLVPFNEVNLTVLASWASNAPTKVSVDNDFVQDIVDPNTGYYSTYYRGRVTGQGSSGPATITATARTGNTGLTSGVISSSGNPDGYALSPTDDANPLSDSITVTRLAVTTTFGISGNLQLTFGAGNLASSTKPKQTTWGANASPNSGVTCTFTGQSNNPGYSCTVPQGWTGTITPFASSSGSSGNDAVGTTYYFSPTSRSHTNVQAAVPNQNFNLCKVQSYCLP